MTSSQIRQDPRFPDVAIHESAYVDERVSIGAGTKIWHFSHILSNVAIGANCVIGQNAMIGPKVVVGDGVRIQNNVSLYEGVTLEDDVFCGPSCVFTNVNNPRSFVSRKDEFRTTRVGKGASIGANATIVCGNDIGEYAFISRGRSRHLAGAALCFDGWRACAARGMDEPVWREAWS